MDRAEVKRAAQLDGRWVILTNDGRLDLFDHPPRDLTLWAGNRV